MTQSTVLVTGGAGFIGANLATELLGNGHDVVVLDDLSGGAVENVPEGARFIEGNVCDSELVDRLFDTHRFDHVFHLAAYAAEGLSHFIKRFNYTNNVIGSVNLINASVRTGTVKRFVFTSSIAVYGANQLPMTEDLVPAPEDSYGIAKYAVERELAVTHELFDLPYTVFRPHNVYGEFQNIGDRYRNVIGIFMNQAMRDEPFTIFGDGEQTRAFSYIGDVVPAIARSIDLPETAGQTYNVGGDNVYTVNELARRTAAVMGVDLSVTYLPMRNEVHSAYADHSKARAAFGLADSLPLEEGLARMAEWVKRQGPQEPSVFSDIEIHKNLPPSWAAVLETGGR
ncbi:UDP-glucose 4-epimerase [Stackebrandtia endophytica]|uniref:UDP-glucose 4-epimerase n=1 Tax=Stackebrandtia endophytica TaxID=1496996 RepID=A0A543AT20_9ACTN|nr:NAD-dependent epimerase/dehydratase family protein [Stackebrandtia endophytica]TQL75727.1 UDP-glucose 4-epimerase [Stackebrandtia endophytica]